VVIRAVILRYRTGTMTTKKTNGRVLSRTDCYDPLPTVLLLVATVRQFQI